MKVQDVMTRPVQTCPRKATANEALHSMWTEDVGALPVVSEDGRVVGMVTDRDLAMAVFLRGEVPARIPVDEVISHRVWSVLPEDSIAHAEEVMRDRQVRRLPVVAANGRLIGMLTMSDLARASTSSMFGPSAANVARTLGAITAARAAAFGTG